MLEDIRAKKSLGQNFLKSESALYEICKSAELNKNDLVLEIGPGKGALTEKLLETGCEVLAIEKDNRLISELNEKFAEFSDKFQLIEKDILDFEPSKEIVGEYKLVANIPYYLTGLIIRRFLENKKQPKIAVLLVQKEVANRIVAKDLKESLLSISVKIYAEPEFIKTVKAGSFVPAPKVDSAILKLSKISKENFTKNGITENSFFKVVKAGFAHNRKKVSSNLKEVIDKNITEKYLIKENLTNSTRAEDLKLKNWIDLTKISLEK